jgi:hypothetical protein
MGKGSSANIAYPKHFIPAMQTLHIRPRWSQKLCNSLPILRAVLEDDALKLGVLGLGPLASYGRPPLGPGFVEQYFVLSEEFDALCSSRVTQALSCRYILFGFQLFQLIYSECMAKKFAFKLPHIHIN